MEDVGAFLFWLDWTEKLKDSSLFFSVPCSRGETWGGKTVSSKEEPRAAEGSWSWKETSVFSQSGSHAAEDRLIIHQFGCTEPDCTGLCLLLTFLVITVIVIIGIVIVIFSLFFFLFFTNYNSAYCLSIKRWNLWSFMKNACRTLWKRVEGL